MLNLKAAGMECAVRAVAHR